MVSGEKGRTTLEGQDGLWWQLQVYTSVTHWVAYLIKIKNYRRNSKNTICTGVAMSLVCNACLQNVKYRN